MQKTLGIKKRAGADTLNNKVNEVKGYVDKFMNQNTCKEYMMINKKTPRVTRTKKYLAKSELTINRQWENSECMLGEKKQNLWPWYLPQQTNWRKVKV